MIYNKKFLFYLQFIGIATWLTVLYINFSSIMKGNLVSIIFLIIGIIFIIFHLTLIGGFIYEKHIDQNTDELEKNLKDLMDDLNGNV